MKLLRAGLSSLAFLFVASGNAFAQAVPTPSPEPSPAGAPSAPASPAPLIATPAQLNVRAGTSGNVQIAGAHGALSAVLQPKIASIAIDRTTDTITLTAQIPAGRATLHVSDVSGASVDVPVRIAQDAGTIARSALLRVTGNPLDPLWLQEQVTQSVNRVTQAQGGTQVQLGSFAVPPSLPPGATAAIPVPVTIESGDGRYFNVADTTSVTVEHVAAGPFSPPVLYYDDDPEKLVSDGVLYRGSVSVAQPARLYYYHENGRDPRQLLVVLTAQDAPATVQVIDSTAGPNADVLTVGHNATRNFLLIKSANEGTLVDVSPQQPYVLHAIPMGPLELVAGSVDLRVRSGGPVTVTVLAVPNGATASQIAETLAQPQLPGDGHKRTGAFALVGSYTTQTLAYTVGGPDASTLYGGTTPPPAQAGQSGKDYGDYGVLREIDFNASNPTGAAVTLYLYEKPQGGVVRSSFLVDGVLHEVGCARVPQAYLIAPLTLAAGQREKIAVVTMTDGASSYPLEVGLTATPPASSVPPIFSAEGCFPKPGF